jgi:antitoxin VapB
MQIEAIDIQTIAGQQAIYLPQSLKIEDNKVYVKKEGNVLHIIPFHNPWQGMIDSLDNFTEDFMSERSQQTNQDRESLD